MRRSMLHGRRLAVAVGALAVVGLTAGSLAATAAPKHATAGSTLVVDKSFDLKTSDPQRQFEPTGGIIDHAVYDRTRAQVREELFAARTDGTTKVLVGAFNPLAAMKADKTRADVAADALASRPVAVAMHGEDSGSFMLSRMQAHEARAMYVATRKDE